MGESRSHLLYLPIPPFPSLRDASLRYRPYYDYVPARNWIEKDLAIPALAGARTLCGAQMRGRGQDGVPPPRGSSMLRMHGLIIKRGVRPRLSLHSSLIA